MRLLLLAAAGLFAGRATSTEPPPSSPEAVEFFEKRVRPILVDHCYRCHSERKQQAGLRLDSAAGMRKGADDGPILNVGNADQSRLLKSIRRQGDFPMPPTQALPQEALDVLTQWVKAGAPFPESKPTATATLTAVKNHWAFQPVVDPLVPTTRVDPGSANPVDQFLLAKLESQGLGFSKPADKRTLIRRAYYDLIGLPPTAAEVEAFEKDTDPKAFARLVDQLLASPHYGERWGRYWLDLARYADSKGYVFNQSRAYPFAYTFRDYVIRSLNEDKPYNRFVVEQLAADKLDLGSDPRPLAAMGFLTVGRRFNNNTHDIIDDRIDVVTRGLMGLTVGCARCHDHKYDPVPMSDYYALYGVFANSVEPDELPQIGAIERTPEVVRFEAEVARREATLVAERDKLVARRVVAVSGLAGGLGHTARDFPKLLNRADRNALTALQKKVDELKATSPVAPPRAMVLNDAPRISEPVVFLRGNPNNRGPRVERKFPAVASPSALKRLTQGSGRLEMAQAITDPSNPLTARVFVNRVWGYHFGQPLVSTPSDFGIRSDPPSHPALLDWLATRFVADGWSVKALHRRMMLSVAYCQASDTRPGLTAVDPENRLLGRMNRRRLDFESLRDSLLFAAGRLDRTVGGRSVDLFARPFSNRRTVYASVDRQNLPGTLSVFDFANPDAHSPQRFTTSVPQQALFLLNSPFLLEQARAVAARWDVRLALGKDTRVRQLYRVILGRVPTSVETQQAVAFLTEAGKEKPTTGQLGPTELLAQVLLLSNEFAFVD